jgi:hypothetical protein
MYHSDANINLAVERSVERMQAVRAFGSGRGLATYGADAMAEVEAGGRRLGAPVGKLLLIAGLIGGLVLAVAASF